MRWMRTRSMILAGLLPLTAATVLGTTATGAERDGTAPADVLAAVDGASGSAPVSGQTHTPKAGDGNQLRVSISTRAQAGSRIQTPGGHRVEVGAPEGSDDVGSKMGASVVFADLAEDVSLVNRPTDEGAQSLIVIAGPEAPSLYSFPIRVDGSPARLRPIPDGSVEIRGATSPQPVALVTPAWALDAQGDAVPTRYRVQGSNLIQVVEHVGSEYPVVADPNTCGTVTCTYYFNKRQTKDLSGLTKAAAVCAFLLKFPIAAAGCGAAAGVVSYQADRAKNRNMCLKIKYTRFGAPVWWPDIYRGGYCK